MSFNEDSRVEIPTILHLCRLGYHYISLKELEWDKEKYSLLIFDDSISCKMVLAQTLKSIRTAQTEVVGDFQ